VNNTSRSFSGLTVQVIPKTIDFTLEKNMAVLTVKDLCGLPRKIIESGVDLPWHSHTTRSHNSSGQCWFT